MAALAVVLKLAREKCVEHESLTFEVAVRNDSTEAMNDLPALDPKNLALEIVLRSASGSRTANQLSSRSRDGGSFHSPDRPKTASLKPGESMTCTGDLLHFFGGIASGSYNVSAIYTTGFGPVESAAAALAVDGAKAVTAAAAHQCQGMLDAPLANAWVRAGIGKGALFYQEASVIMPANAYRGFKVSSSFEGTHLTAPQLPYADVPAAHICWSSGNGKLKLAVVDRVKWSPAEARDVSTPFDGGPLASPESMRDGSVWIPFADAKRERVVALHVKPDSNVRAAELRVGSLSPVSSYVSLWDYDANLYFAWASAGRPEVRCAVLSLTEPEGEFKALFATGLDAPVVWLDGYVDLGETDARDPILWCVRRKASAFMCCKFRVGTTSWITDTLLPADGLPELKPCGSVVGADRRLGLLFTGPKGEMWYGSTKDARIWALKDADGKPVTNAQSPSLVAASKGGVFSWIYLRYNSTKGSISMLKIEPVKELDPAAAWK